MECGIVAWIEWDVSFWVVGVVLWYGVLYRWVGKGIVVESGGSV